LLLFKKAGFPVISRNHPVNSPLSGKLMASSSNRKLLHQTGLLGIQITHYLEWKRHSGGSKSGFLIKWRLLGECQLESQSFILKIAISSE
jgi:hypothetical protein